MLKESEFLPLQIKATPNLKQDSKQTRLVTPTHRNNQ